MVNRKYILLGFILFSLMLTGVNAVKKEKKDKIVSTPIYRISPTILSESYKIPTSVTSSTDSLNNTEQISNVDDIPSMFVSKKHLKKIKDKKIKEAAAQVPKVKNYKENEVIVVLKKSLNNEGLKKIKENKSLQVLKKIKLKTKVGDKIVLIIKSKDDGTEKLVKKLKGLYYIDSVSPNFIYQLDQTIPDDSSFDELWGLHNTGQTSGAADKDIDGPEAWDTQTGSKDTVVAIIDTGVDYSHNDLTANMWINSGEVPGDGIDNDENNCTDDIYGCNLANYNSTTEKYDGDPMDFEGHGTHIAGTIGAEGNNGIGVTGINWTTSIMALKIANPDGSLSSVAIIESFSYIMFMKQRETNPVNIVAVNASYGYYDSGFTVDPDTDPMNGLIKDLGDLGIIFCASAGNGTGDADPEGDDNELLPHYPSDFHADNIIAVASTDHDDNYSSFSNYGVNAIDLAAPGSSILSSIAGESYLPQSGDIFFDDMESGIGNWISDGTNNTWAISEDQEGFENTDFPVPSPTHFLSDSPGVDYQRNTDSWIMLANDIDLSTYSTQDVYFGFGAAWAMDDTGDHAYVEVSGDSGGTWVVLEDFVGYAGFYWINPYSYIIPDSVKTENFRIRFRIQTNGGNGAWDGILVDNVGIGTTLIDNQYDYYNGTSMATPHVTGTVTLLAAEFPDENITVRKDRVLASVDPLLTTGKTVTDGRLNLYNALQNPALVSITPQYGMIDSNSFTLDGHSFGDVTGSVEFVDGDGSITEAVVTAWADTQITATIPSGQPGKHIRVARSTNSKSQYVDGSRWTNETALSTGFDSAATVSSGSKIYAIGGQSSFTETASFRIYDPASGWSSGTDIPTPRSYAASAVLDGNIYVMGGYSQSTGQVVDTVEIYDIATNTWSDGIPLPFPLAFARAAVLNEEIYISGGTHSGVDAVATMYKFNGTTWSQETDMLDSRMAHGMIEYNNLLYVFGGADWYYQTGADYTQSKKMYIYDSDGVGSWSDSGKDLPIALARFGFSGGFEGSDIVIKIAGGTTDTTWWSNQLQTVMTYNFTTNQWYQTNEGLDELIVNKIGSGMVFIDGQGFYNIGGYSEEEGTLDDFEKYE